MGSAEQAPAGPTVSHVFQKFVKRIINRLDLHVSCTPIPEEFLEQTVVFFLRSTKGTFAVCVCVWDNTYMWRGICVRQARLTLGTEEADMASLISRLALGIPLSLPSMARITAGRTSTWHLHRFPGIPTLVAVRACLASAWTTEPSLQP